MIFEHSGFEGDTVEVSVKQLLCDLACVTGLKRGGERRGDWGEKESLFHCAIFPPSLRFFVPTTQAICDPKSGCSLTQALWIQHLMITHNYSKQ